MKFFGSRSATKPAGGVYATSADFCRVFEEDMDRLYLLSLLLTADPGLAERCFVRGLEDSKSGNPVFKEWARSWARRKIVTNAIAAIKPRNEVVPASLRDMRLKDVPGVSAKLAPVVSLQAFDRFVFVMSVLEKYPERDVRLLLDSSSADVIQARTRALEKIGALAEMNDKPVNGIQLATDGRELTLAPSALPHFAASA